MSERGTIGVAVGGAADRGADGPAGAINGTLGARSATDSSPPRSLSARDSRYSSSCRCSCPRATRVRRLVDGIRSRTVPPWMLLGGLAGAFTVASQGLTVARIVGGGAVHGRFVAGQTTAVSSSTGSATGRGGRAGHGASGGGRAAGDRGRRGVPVGRCARRGSLWMLIVRPSRARESRGSRGTNGRLRGPRGEPAHRDPGQLHRRDHGPARGGVGARRHRGGSRVVPTEPWSTSGERWESSTSSCRRWSCDARVCCCWVRVGGRPAHDLRAADALWPAPAAPATPVAVLAAAVAIAGSSSWAAVPWRRRIR